MWNRCKSKATSGTDPQLTLFHPQDQFWEEHFEWFEDGTILHGLAAQVRSTIDCLKINRPAVVRVRRMRVEMGEHSANRDDQIHETKYHAQAHDLLRWPLPALLAGDRDVPTPRPRRQFGLRRYFAAGVRACPARHRSGARQQAHARPQRRGRGNADRRERAFGDVGLRPRFPLAGEAHADPRYPAAFEFGILILRLDARTYRSANGPPAIPVPAGSVEVLQIIRRRPATSPRPRCLPASWCPAY